MWSCSNKPQTETFIIEYNKETGTSRHHGGPIEAPPLNETLRNNIAVERAGEGFQEALIFRLEALPSRV